MKIQYQNGMTNFLKQLKMKRSIWISTLALVFISSNLVGQYTPPPPPPNAKELALTEQALVSLDEILNSPENIKLKAQIQEDVSSVTSLPHFTLEDYKNVEHVYVHFSRLYNNLYLAEMKLNLSNYKQFNRLSKNPGKQAKKFENNHAIVIEYYEKRFFPVINEIRGRNISADYFVQPNSFSMVTASLQLLDLGVRSLGSLFRGINNSKRKRQSLAKNFIDQANFQFAQAQVPEWSTLGINGPSGNDISVETEETRNYQEDENEDTEENASTYVEENNQYTEENASTYVEENYDPPMDYASLESVSGEIYFEVYDEENDYDAYMPIEQGPMNDIAVNDYGDGGSDATFDLIIGAKKGKKPAKRNKLVTQFGTMDSYPAGTLYRVRSTGNGFIYVFSINSGNRMFSIFPYQGELEKIPSGTNYDYPYNAIYQDDGSISVSIPDNVQYIEISDAPGKLVPRAETMIVLCSRSQLDFRDVLQQMQDMGESMSPEARLAQIFGTLAASPQDADAYVNDGVLNYMLEENDPSVLPLVFGIRRQ